MSMSKQYVIELGSGPDGDRRLVGPFADPSDAVAWAASHSVAWAGFRLTELTEPWTVEAVTG